ncbi:unannotated protein [freshwater metagenome]|uniref:Unannotated protein n=1 Tax=freshwater metagenome TaxID=449393 RepID=A0A6J7RKW2_9ZZZZ
MLRRLLVFGGLGIILLVGLRMLASFVTPEASESVAPNPIPVVTPAFDCAANTPIPQTFIDSWALEYAADTYNFTIIDLVENCTYAFGDAASSFPTASTGKVVVATGVLEMVAAGTLDYAKVADDMKLMITQSDNGAADRLFKVIGRNDAVISIAKRFGLTQTTTGGAWGTIMTSSADQALLLNQVVGQQESPLPEAQRVILRELMTSINPDQAWGAGHGTPSDWQVAVKNGWYLSVAGDRPPVGMWRINTLGYTWDSKAQPRWIFTGYSNTWETQERGISAWNAISEQLVTTMGSR